MADKISTVVVLLSTYNGQEFVAEQLDSLFVQVGIDLRIIVRDDGSTDNTLGIIKKYKDAHPGQIILIEGENVGWRKSFFKLVEYAAQNTEGKFYAFSDQDDIWQPEKLRVAVSALDSMPVKKLPRLYCSNLFYYKNGINFGLIRKEKPNPTYKNCLVRNYATGCTIVFDYNLLKLMANHLPTITVAHDYWSYMAAVLCGNVFVDDESYILYRQHENNQIGCKSGWLDVWKRRLMSFRQSSPNHMREHQAKELLKCFSNAMLPEAKIAVENLANYKISFCNRLSLMFDNGYTMNRFSNDFWLKMRILLGRF